MQGYLEVENIERNFAECKVYTRHYAKTFYFASHVLPREKRKAAYAVYAFCRYADNLVDNAVPGSDTHLALRRLAELRYQLRYVYTFSELMDPKLLAFRETVFHYKIPQQYFEDLLRGVEMDLTKTRYESFGELQDYCYCVASVVGLIMSCIFGVSDSKALERAEDLGTAMQLTNILRDIGEDYDLGRIYLPKDEIDAFGYTEDELARGVVNENFRRFMGFQITRAREYYERAAAGIPLLTNDGSRFCVRLMSQTYGNILEVIEHNGFDVFGRRAFVHFSKKLWIAVGAAMSIPGKGEAGESSALPNPTGHRSRGESVVFVPSPQKT
jgi:15-cis-phytoene synthase